MKISACTSICATFLALASIPAFALKPQTRITAPIENTQRAEIAGSVSSHAHASMDRGALAANTPLSAITLVFSRSAAQQQALDALIEAQQNPASPQYHQFLTPEQFGAEFGMTDADIASTESWLEQQGFTIQGVSRSRDRVTFSGTAAQVTNAFGTQLHNYATTDGMRFAPSTALSVPSALASSVLTVTNLSSFRPRPRVKFAPVVKPHYTSGQSGNIFLGPLDVGTIYDVNATYGAGFNGAGQSIAIVGQSAIVATDITHFQTGFGYTAKAPVQILVPNTGGSTIYSGDEAESDLDLEYSGAMAPGATIYFVYVGSSNNADVFDSVQYAVQNSIAPIISISYGECEPDLNTTDYGQLNAILQQAAAQGQTVISASGDSGSTDCFTNTSDTTLVREAPAADFPSSSQYVTGLGGTGIPSADLSSTYFNATTGGVDLPSSAKSYVPEQVWNDSAYLTANGDPGDISAGGGGTSIYTSQPTWQASFPGITAGTNRTVPDVSLLASAAFPGYIYCTSDTTAWFSGQTSSCTSNLRDASSQSFTLAGGTSFAAPIFAGLVAVLNQAKGYNGTGQGLINPTLYTLASNSTTYASAFHDITVGGNECAAGTTYCSSAGTASYFATAGYDEASGLGSIDFTNLVTAWPASATSSLINTTTTLSPATANPVVGATDAITITVASVTGATVPAGTVTIFINGTSTATQTLSNGATTYNFSKSAVGVYTVKAVYAPTDTTHAASSGTISINIGSVTISAANVIIAQGSTGTVAVTVTPFGGYTGTFNYTLTAPQALYDACYTGSFANITGTTAVTSTVTIYTNTSNCPSTASPLFRGARGASASASLTTPINMPSKRNPLAPLSAGLAFAGLFALGLLGRRSRSLRTLVAVAVMVVAGYAITGCSSNATTAPPSTLTSAPKGTYVITVSGQDSVDSTISATTTFTLTVD